MGVSPLKHTLLTVYGIVTLLVAESFIFGVSVLPGLALWRAVFDVPIPYEYLRIVVIAMTFVPAYFVFSLTLMFVTAGFVRLFRWQTPVGEHRVADLTPEVLRWARGSAAAHLVRMFTGELFRTSPMWTVYMRAMGAKVGKNVYVNTPIVYDFNLLEIGDNTVIGGHASLVAHSVEKGILHAAPVRIGKNCVIGVGSIVTPGVQIGDHTQIGALSYIPKHTVIPANCAVGGVPVRIIKHYGPEGGPPLWETKEFVLSEQA